MILRPSLRQFLLAALIYSSVAVAWPWPPSFPDVEGLILRRDDSTTSSSETKSTADQTTDSKTSDSKTTASPASKSSSDTAAATTSSDSDTTTTGKKPSGTTATSGGKSKAVTTTNSKKPQSTDVDPRLPPGGVNMVTPSALATSTYYKIGVDSVSFVWNYTSLSVTPSKIDVLVTCTANQAATYTLASNTSFEETGTVVWDTRPDMSGETGLLTEMYTLLIYDAEKAPTDTAEAGHLGAFNQHVFGMYRKQDYTPRSDWKCVSCNGALSDTERQALKFMAAMCGVTILSFTWFVGGFGAVF